MEFTTKSAQETQESGKRFALDIIPEKDSAVILALKGDLGSGKTTFVQGLSKGLGVEKQVISPTFILMREYDLPEEKVFSRLYHIDLYRFEEDADKEAINIGIKDLWKDPKNIVIIEWAERAENIIPENAIWIRFEYLGEKERKITINK